MDDAWCHGRVGNCATCHGLWCAAAMLEASANQNAARLAGVARKSVAANLSHETVERLAGVASKSVEANLHEAHECKDEGEVCWVEPYKLLWCNEA